MIFEPKIESSRCNKQNKTLYVSFRRPLLALRGLTQCLSDFLNVLWTRFFYTQTARGVAPCHFLLSNLVADIVILKNHDHGGKINDFNWSIAILNVWSVREKGWRTIVKAWIVSLFMAIKNISNTNTTVTKIAAIFVWDGNSYLHKTSWIVSWNQRRQGTLHR